MPVQRVYAHEEIKEDAGKVTLMRGPLVYCVEAADQPDVNISRLALPVDSKLSAEHRGDLLGGVTVIKGAALADGKPVTLTAIPYYAWSNREKGAMTVWMDQAKP